MGRELRFRGALRRLAPLLALAAVSNASIATWLTRGRPLPRAAGAASLAVDALLLAGLLEVTGGPFNPFTVVFAVQVALAALTLGSPYAVLLVGFVAACLGFLVYDHLRDFAAVHHRLADFPAHLFTMWFTVAVTSELVAYFIVQASSAVARREEEIEAMRRQAARTQRLVAVTTLAAGAAHELSTPLATIALASRELQRTAEASPAGAALLDDARLIRMEVDRCQAILDQMSGRAGGVAADDPESIDVAALVGDLKGRLSPQQAARLEVDAPTSPILVNLPRSGLSQAVFSLVRNAFDASGDGSPVIVRVSPEPERVRIAVEDAGGGMPPDVRSRAGEPFFTTKEAGRGFGPGLFLARVFAERVGGSLALDSREGTTTACLDLPAAPRLPAIESRVLERAT